LPAAHFSGGISADVRAGFATLLSKISPALAAATAGTRQVGPYRAFAGVAGFMREAAGPGWALVGDAGYFKDPLTAHGITDALRDAELLANAAVGGSAAGWRQYGEERNDLSLGLFETTNAIASFEWDLVTVRPLHRRLKEAMKQEVAAIGAFDAGDRGLAA
jgi:flavin-dependent dehydrogenase